MYNTNAGAFISSILEPTKSAGESICTTICAYGKRICTTRHCFKTPPKKPISGINNNENKIWVQT